MIDKGIPTTGLLAQVLVAKFLDHLPLYRQEQIFERAGLAIARSTLAQWVGECGVQLQPLVRRAGAELRRHGVLHADETPVAMLKPGNGKTHRAYLWSYCTTSLQPDAGGGVRLQPRAAAAQHVREFLGLPSHARSAAWQGTLVTDDFSGYKACFELGVTEVGCMAHARRKFHELWANHGSDVGEQALQVLQCSSMRSSARSQELAAPRAQADTPANEREPVADALHQWLTGAAAEGARRLGHGQGDRLQPQALDGTDALSSRTATCRSTTTGSRTRSDRSRSGASNWLFAGSLRAGKRAAAVMSLLHSARINGHDPYAYLQGRARAAADAAGQPHRRAAAASLAAGEPNTH